MQLLKMQSDFLNYEKFFVAHGVMVQLCNALVVDMIALKTKQYKSEFTAISYKKNVVYNISFKFLS